MFRAEASRRLNFSFTVGCWGMTMIFHVQYKLLMFETFRFTVESIFAFFVPPRSLDGNKRIVIF